MFQGSATRSLRVPRDLEQGRKKRNFHSVFWNGSSQVAALRGTARGRWKGLPSVAVITKSGARVRHLAVGACTRASMSNSKRQTQSRGGNKLE